MLNLTEAQLDLLLFIGPPVFVLHVLVCVVVQLWRGVRVFYSGCPCTHGQFFCPDRVFKRVQTS